MSKSDLVKKLIKASKNPYIDMLEDSEYLNDDSLTSTDILGLNIALSGELDGGFSSGVITIAGKSKHFKTLFGLEMVKGYLRDNPDGVLVFFDSEFGSPKDYFYGVLGEEYSKRVIHAPVTTVEDLRTQFMNQLDAIERSDKVIFMLDSIGNLASIKETEDALSGKQSVDMTRAKMIKSLFRLITPQLTLKDKTLIVINHTYNTLEMFSKEVMGGGTGTVYSSDTIFFIGKQQEKDGKDLLGWNFIINIEKSRFVKEKEKLGILVTYENGVNKFSGIFDLAVECGIIGVPSKGFYQYPNMEDTPKRRRKEIENDVDVMNEICKNEEFNSFIKNKYKLFGGANNENTNTEEE
jgi:hypothetical protein